ncbi:MAG TPA: ABC transporter permease [Gemmata sp.]|nr:ABC transporter permease [Gemmata sp.]
MPRWSVVRLISAREIRDQLRDRRTLFLILGLPVLMYPLFIGVGLLFYSAIKEKQFVIAVVGERYLPGPSSDSVPLAAAAIGGSGASYAQQHAREFPPLLIDGQFAAAFLDGEKDRGSLIVKPQESADEGMLARREADAILIVEPDFAARLERGERPTIRVRAREGEENSKLAVRRLVAVLHSWEDAAKETRFARAGFGAEFDSPFKIQDPQSDKPPEKKTFDELRDTLVKVIPFLLVMWMLTGAIYPAIDMTAGEKERGTMETLLISPAERGEIVLGKFLAVVTMAFGTALWNVLLMVVAVTVAPLLAPAIRSESFLSLPGLLACVLASLPIAMLIAACTLSLGVFARSTKEGNYYMVPMFLVTLPLSYWSMSPGMELDGVTSWVPVANALLLQQRLMSVRTDPFPWIHLPAVVISLSICIAIALWAAVRQFHRESVLFREAETSRGKWSLLGFRKQWRS